MSDDPQELLEQFERAREGFDKDMKAFTCKGTGTNVDDKLISSAISYMVSNDYEKAIPAFEDAANQGHMGAQHALGEILYGLRDEKKAVYWFKKAAEQGHPNSANWLGTIYYNGGTFIKINKTKAKYWYKRSEKLGSEVAIRNLYQNNLSFTDPLLIFLSIIAGIVTGSFAAVLFGFFGFIVGAVAGWIIVTEMRKRL
jgi:TPR repeat protein